MDSIRIELGANNLYLLRAKDGWLCIDAGPDYEGAWEELTAQLAAHQLTPAAVRTVVLTHAHPDHAGLAARWQQTGAAIWAGKAEEHELALDADGRRALRERAVAVLLEHGVPPELLAQPRPARAGGRPLGERGSWPGPLRVNPVRPDRLLSDGELLEDAGLTPRVMHCPGHTPGTILLRDDAAGVVYTGDHLLPRTSATAGIQFTGTIRRPSLPEFVRSLERSRSLAGMVVMPGHGESMPDAGAAVTWTLSYLERRAERLRRRLADGADTAYDLATRLLRHLRPEHVWPVMAETIGLLDLLRERGEAVAERSSGLIVYRLARAAERH